MAIFGEKIRPIVEQQQQQRPRQQPVNHLRKVVDELSQAEHHLAVAAQAISELYHELDARKRGITNFVQRILDVIGPEKDHLDEGIAKIAETFKPQQEQEHSE